MAETALAIGVIAASLASTGASYHQSQEVSREAKDAKRDMENEQLKLKKEAADKEAQTDAQKALEAANRRQQSILAGAASSSPRQTILTSPLGEVGPGQNYQRRTLLG